MDKKKVVDIGKLANAKWFTASSAAGWGVDDLHLDDTRAKAWIYSIHLNGEPRAMGQITIEGLRVMRERAKISDRLKQTQIAEIIRIAPNAIELIERAEDFDDRSGGLSVLAQYISLTKTFAQIPQDGYLRGVHLLVIDWLVASDEWMLRPFAIVGEASPFNPEQVVYARDQVMAIDRANHPERFTYQDFSR